jgi:ribosomal protein S18 acetylase RimI-like enzyme
LNFVPRSLVWATDIDVLPVDRVVERRDGYLVIRSPSNPTHYWGNLLLFDDPPSAGDAARWETRFAEEFQHEPRVRHRTFAWDRADGVAGAAKEEFGARGYDVEESIGLVASPAAIRRHPRENRDVVVKALDADADDDLWTAVVELQVAGRDVGHDEHDHREFSRVRMHDRRVLYRSGHGAWYVAVDPATDEVVGSCGVIVWEGRGRFQAVETALAHRRRGIASRLVAGAALHAAENYGAEQLVIVAEVGYHALGLYESLGFERKEHVFGVCLWPRGADAGPAG